jgi:hypothetical protein
MHWLLTFVVGLVAVLVLRLWRGFFWPHAAIVGMAIAALFYSAWRTWENVRGGGE